MLQPRVIPCLLVKNGRLIKTVKFTNSTYVGDPVNAIKIYNEKEVDELIILDISASKEGRDPNYELIEEISGECFMPLCYGGGIKNVEQMTKLFKLGIEKVSINSALTNNMSVLTHGAKNFGSQSIVASIDIKKNLFGNHSVYTFSGKKNLKLQPERFAKDVENAGAGEILLNSINQDGTWEGLNIELISSITSKVNIPVIATGGAGNLSHIKEAIFTGKSSAVGLGSMAVFQGKDLGVLINFPKRDTLEKLLEIK